MPRITLLVVLLFVFCLPALASSSDQAIASVQQLERDVSQAAEHAQRQRTAVGANLVDDFARRSLELRLSLPDTEADTAAAARKLSQVIAVLGNLTIYNRRLSEGHADKLPYSDLPRGRAIAIDSAARGGSCARPWPLGLKEPIELSLAPAGQANDAIWIRLSGEGAAKQALSTLGSNGDLRIDWFESCTVQPIASTDDTYGLQEIGAPQDRQWVARITNNDKSSPIAARIEAILQATIAGQVLGEPGGIPANGISVFIFQSPNTYYTYTATVTNGAYTAYFYSPGTFKLRTGITTSNIYLHEAYPDILCSDPQGFSLYTCGPGSPSELTLVDGQALTGIDFNLSVGRAITFSVTNAATGDPVPGAVVQVSEPSGIVVGTQTADASGIARQGGLRTGISYFAYTRSSGYRSEAFDNIPCPDTLCPPTLGTPITFTANSATNRNLAVALTPLQSLQVNLPLMSGYSAGQAELLYPSGQVAKTAAAYGTFGSSWATATFVDIAPGTYYVRARYMDATAWRLHPNIDCLDNCSSLLPSATAIVVDAQSQLPDLYLIPKPFPTVSGAAVDAESGAPIAGAIAYLIALNSSTYRTVLTNEQGEFSFAYAAPGSYILAILSTTHQDAAYPNAACQIPPYGALVCPNATPIPISFDQASYRYTIALARSGSIRGSVRVDGIPFPADTSIAMYARRVGNGEIEPGRLRVTGSDYVLDDLPPGQYYLIADATAAAHGAAWPDRHCSPCGTTVGTPLALSSAMVDNIDFNLHLSRGAKGRVLSASTGQPVSGVVVDLWEQNSEVAQFYRSGVTRADGTFTIPYFGFRPTLRLSTTAGGSYVDEVYNNVACPFGPAYFGLCNILSGELLVSAVALDSSGVTVRLNEVNSDFVFQDGLE